MKGSHGEHHVGKSWTVSFGEEGNVKGKSSLRQSSWRKGGSTKSLVRRVKGLAVWVVTYSLMRGESTRFVKSTFQKLS